MSAGTAEPRNVSSPGLNKSGQITRYKTGQFNFVDTCTCMY